MNETLSILRRLIEERATKKLNADLLRLSENIKREPLLDFNGNLANLLLTYSDADLDKVYSSTLRDMFECFNPDSFPGGEYSWYMLALKQYWLPVYIEREITMLLESQGQEEIIVRDAGIRKYPKKQIL